MSFKKSFWSFLLLVAAGTGVVLTSDTVYSQPPGNQEDRELLDQFDTDKNGWLSDEERKPAREFVKENPSRGRGGPGGPGGGRGRGGPGGGQEQAKPTQGMTVDKADVQPLEGDLYDPTVFRTIFIDFQNSDWEQELEDFHNTDVDVAATLTVDGKTLPNCGIRFRGASSYGHVSAGSKRPFNVSIDMADEDQRLLGYKTLNLLNAHGDSSLMSSVLYSRVAREHMAAPKANFVRVVINGENWGVYTNVQQYNKTFLKENYDSSKGARWKVHGSPRGGGGLEYWGDDIEDYRFPYEQKSGGDKSLAKLVEFCRVLNQTPTADLPAALEPICDVDELLWFLALDVGLMNSDGYWVRASDYSIFLDKKDKFHFIPHDMNEAFRAARGGGGPGGGGRGGRGGFGGGPGGFGGGRGGPGGGFGGRGGPEGGFGGGRDGDRGPDGRDGPRDGGRGPEGGFGGGRDGNRGPDGRDGPRDGGRGPEGGGRDGDRGPDGRDGPRDGDRGPGGGRGPGGPGGPGAGGSQTGLDPLIALEDPSKPLRSKVLAVPKYREQYLANLRELAEESLNWEKLGPVVEAQAKLIGAAVKDETRGLSSYEAFVSATSDSTNDGNANASGDRRGGSSMSLKDFIQGRHKFLLEYKQPTKD